MINRIAPLAIGAAAIFSVATFTATDASARGHASGRPSAGGQRSHVSHVRPATRPSRPARTRSTGGTRAGTARSLRPSRSNVSSRINRIRNLNRAGVRNNVNGRPRALSANQSGLPRAVLAMRLAHIRQQLQNGTIRPAVAAAQIAHLMHGNQAGNGTPGGNTPLNGVCIHAPCNIPGGNTHPPRPPHPECFAGSCHGNHQTPGSTGGHNRPQGPVAAGNGQGRPFRSFRFGSTGNGGGARTGGAPTVAAGGPAAQPVANSNNTNNCLTRTTLPDGAILFRDICTGQIAVAPAQAQDQPQENGQNQGQQ